MDCTVLMLPGYGGSGPDHWQSFWQGANEGFVRVGQHDWLRPVCGLWVAELEGSVSALGGDVVLVAHSLGCLLVPHWASRSSPAVDHVRGALLVAPPDPAAEVFPVEASGFTPLPLMPLPFRSILVASSNDPYASSGFSRSMASLWGSSFVDAGAAGHLNAGSGLGAWPEGLRLLEGLCA